MDITGDNETQINELEERIFQLEQDVAVHEQRDRERRGLLLQRYNTIQEYERFIKYSNLSGKWDAWKKFNKS